MTSAYPLHSALDGEACKIWPERPAAAGDSKAREKGWRQ